MRQGRKWTFLPFVIVLALSVTACGGNGSTGKAETGTTEGQPEGNEPIKLRIAWWGSQDRHDKTLKALELYMSLNPHVTFEPEYSGWDGYWDKLATQSAAGNAPDIIQMDAMYIGDYGRRNQLAELTHVRTEDVDTSLLNTGKFEGKLLALPLGNNSYGVIYNKAAMDKLGVQLTPDWSWEQYFALASELKPKLAENQYVFGDSTLDTGVYATYQLAKGKGQPSPPDGTFNYDKELWIEFLNIYKDLRGKGLVPPADVTVSDKELDVNSDLMVNGTTLLRHAHSSQIAAWDGLMPGQVDMVGSPREVEAGSWLKSSMFWSVSQSSKHTAEAERFIDWFINDLDVAKVLKTSRGVPVSKAVLESLDAEFTPADKLGIQAIGQIAKDAQTFSPGPGNLGNWNLFNKELGTQLELVLFDQTTPEEAWEVIEEAGMKAEASVKE